MTIRQTIETIIKANYGRDSYTYHRDHTDPEQNGLREFSIESPTNHVKIQYGWWWSPKDRCLKVQFGRNGDESDIGLDLCILGLHWFARGRHPKLKMFRITDETNAVRYEPHHTGFYINYAGIPLGWSIDYPENSGRRHQYAKWRQFDLYKHKIFGRQTVDTVTIASGDEQIEMPEGHYPCTWETTEYRRTYKRWPGTLLQRLQNMKDDAADRTINFEIPGGIPSWGKGENSYDCGMDATFGLSMSLGGHSPRSLTYEVARSVMKNREKTGLFELPKPMGLTEAEEHLKSIATPVGVQQ